VVTRRDASGIHVRSGRRRDDSRQQPLSVEENRGRTPHWLPDATGFIYETGYVGREVESALYIANPGGDARTAFAYIPGSNRSPAWSRDGSALATTADTWDLGLRSAIVVMDADGENQRIVTSNPRGSDDMPTWSPDGRRIAYVAYDTSANNTHLSRWSEVPRHVAWDWNKHLPRGRARSCCARRALPWRPPEPRVSPNFWRPT